MPNWCSNSLYVSGDSNKVKEFKGWVIAEVNDTEIVRDENYNAVLDETGNPVTKEVIREKFTFEKLFPTPLELVSDVDPIPHKEGEDDEAYEIRMNELMERYGASGWYNWRVANWGTKWDACESDWDLDDEELTIHFQTAWAPPIGWLENVSAQFPELVFKMTFQEEGMGFCGRADAVEGLVEWQDGAVILQDEEGLEVEWDTESDRYKYVKSGEIIDDEDFWPIEHNPFDVD